MATFTIVSYCQQIAEHSAPVIPQGICSRIPHSAKHSHPLWRDVLYKNPSVVMNRFQQLATFYSLHSHLTGVCSLIGSRALSFSDHYYWHLCLSVTMSVRMSGCLSVRVFKMLLLRQFLSEWADILTRWSPTLGKLVVLTDSGSGPCDVINDNIKFSV